MKVIAVIGYSGSGKTTTIEYLTRNLTRQGFTIGVMKHVHHPNFTIDTEGKDTWRHARAGAKIVSTVSSDEVAIIRRTRQQRRLDDLLKLFEKDNLNLLFLEGFHQSVSDRHDIYRIISAKSQVELEQVLKNTSDPILAITGKVSTKNRSRLKTRIPVINIQREGQKLIRIIKQNVLGKTRRHHSAIRVTLSVPSRKLHTATMPTNLHGDVEVPS